MSRMADQAIAVDGTLDIHVPRNFDGSILRSCPASGARARYSCYKRRREAKVHAAVDNTLGHLLALMVTTVNRRAEMHTL